MDRFNQALAELGGLLGPYGPKIIGALTIVLVAWGVARLVRSAVGRLGERWKVDAKLQTTGFTQMIAGVGSGVAVGSSVTSGARVGVAEGGGVERSTRGPVGLNACEVAW